MGDDEEAGFQRFLAEHRSWLALISRHTNGEFSVGDVSSEAWLLWRELWPKGKRLDLGHVDDARLLLKYLYQKLVRYTDTKVRFAERLEQNAFGDDDGVDATRLADRLVDDSALDPLQALLNQEGLQQRLPEPPSHESPASALIALLQAFDNRMSKLADYLLISLSHCYRCHAKARRWAIHQHPLRAPVRARDERMTPRPWRKFRITRRVRSAHYDDRQLDLDFFGGGSGSV
jgi:hypothetical protein